MLKGVNTASDARRFLGGRGVHAGNLAVGDRAVDDDAVREARQVDFRRVARAAGDFEPTVRAVHGCADDIGVAGLFVGRGHFRKKVEEIEGQAAITLRERANDAALGQFDLEGIVVL